MQIEVIPSKPTTPILIHRIIFHKSFWILLAWLSDHHPLHELRRNHQPILLLGHLMTPRVLVVPGLRQRPPRLALCAPSTNLTSCHRFLLATVNISSSPSFAPSPLPACPKSPPSFLSVWRVWPAEKGEAATKPLFCFCSSPSIQEYGD